MTGLRLALAGLFVLAAVFRVVVWASTRAAQHRVSPDWLNEHCYDRTGDRL